MSQLINLLHICQYVTVCLSVCYKFTLLQICQCSNRPAIIACSFGVWFIVLQHAHLVEIFLHDFPKPRFGHSQSFIASCPITVCWKQELCISINFSNYPQVLGNMFNSLFLAPMCDIVIIIIMR